MGAKGRFATDHELRKVQPKLRVVANGNTTVNLIRAEQSSAIAARSDAVARRVDIEAGEEAAPVDRTKLKAKRGKLATPSRDIEANVFVSLIGEDESFSLKEATGRRGNLISARVPLSQLRALAARPGVSHVEMGDPLRLPDPALGDAGRRAPVPRSRRTGAAGHHKNGEGVLIGIIDVQGFDFAHPDFLDRNGETRFVRIWDQGGDARPPPSRKAPCNYGGEFHQKHLNRALRVAHSIGVPAQEIERQSQMSPSSHGTHVASIAAGNRGLCPRADLAGVLISLPEGDLDRRRSFYDSTRVAHAVDYLIHLADELGLKAVSINISLGTNGHAHDASSAISRWIDSAIATPGRGVCVAAGNAGQEAPQTPDDIGFVMGRIHTSGKIAAAGLNADIDWIVVGNGVADLSENELEIWYGAQDRFAVSIRPPGASSWIGPIEPGEYIENRELDDGTFLSIYNELYHPANGSNYIAMYLSPFFSSTGVTGVGAGTWTVRLHGREIRDGNYHGWIERDDPRRLGRVGSREYWRFPSFFSRNSNVDSSSVSSLACGHRVVSVANLDEEAERINITSSQGPTREGRTKPEVAAPGTRIVAANGFDDENPWVEMSGTSMASPYVAGVVGLMLATDPSLTAAQIGGIIKRTARPLPGTDFNWRNDAGFGVIDPKACVAEALRVNRKTDVTKRGTR